MDPFALVIIAIVVALIIWVALVGRYSPGGGLDQLGISTSKEISERRSALEADDLQQMVDARNARRRARGEAEVSADDLEMQIMADINAQRRRDAEQAKARQSDADAERELDDLLEATNARRRARGLPERTREDAKREFGR
jgi:hypothetical protein